mgnify:CR=1 FL=1
MKINKVLLFLLAVLLAGLIGWYAGFKLDVLKETESTNISTIIDRIDEVMKMVNVEGQVSEIYDYKSYKGYDFSPFRKKILIRVNAKVLIGYDLEKANIEVNSLTQTVSISSFPEPEIISVDHELDYYDIQEGTFNSFSEEELTQLNKNAKEYATSKALTDELYLRAEQNKDEMIDLLNELISAMSWKLKFEEADRRIKG